MLIQIFVITSICIHIEFYECIYVRFPEGKHAIEVLESPQVLQLPIGEQMFLNRKVIAEIINMAWISDNQV